MRAHKVPQSHSYRLVSFLSGVKVEHVEELEGRKPRNGRRRVWEPTNYLWTYMQLLLSGSSLSLRKIQVTLITLCQILCKGLAK